MTLRRDQAVKMVLKWTDGGSTTSMMTTLEGFTVRLVVACTQKQHKCNISSPILLNGEKMRRNSARVLKLGDELVFSRCVKTY